MREDQKPLRLEQLADVESPEVMRAALARFRRRTLLRGFLIVAAILALPVFFRGLRDRPPSQAEINANVRWAQVGRIIEGERSQLIILDAEYAPEPGPAAHEGFFGERRLLHVVAVSRNVKRGEYLSVQEGAVIVPGPGRVPRRAPPRIAAEGFLGFEAQHDTMTVYVLALTGAEADVAVGPGTHTRRQCGMPLNSLGVCEMLKAEGRLIETFTIRLDELGLPAEIWEE